ncbi:MAG: hypothetical protein WEA24_06105 [Gemmatimonadota bacterium]
MPPEHNDPLAPLLDSPRVRAALEAARAAHPRTLADQREVTAIPAPTGEEGARADWLEGRLREAGVLEVHRDEVGNLLATLRGSTSGGGGSRHAGGSASHSGHSGGAGAEPGAVLAAAHLDTIFPAGYRLRTCASASRTAVCWPPAYRTTAAAWPPWSPWRTCGGRRGSAPSGGAGRVRAGP